MKLSKTQRELLAAMQGGVDVWYWPASFGYSDYYRRADTKRKCTATATVLVVKGLAGIAPREQGARSWHGRDVVLTDAGRAYNTEAPDAG